MRTLCPEHGISTPCGPCRSEHLAEHRTPRLGCPWCPQPEPTPDRQMAAANDQEDA